MEALISGIYQVVADKLGEKQNLLLGVPKEARKMLKKLKSIKAGMVSAEKKELMEENIDVKLWIRDLKKVAYDIEDVLDGWSIVQLQMREQFGISQRGNMPKEEDQVCFSCIPPPSFCIKQGCHEIAHTISAINERLDNIAEREKKLDFGENYPSRNVIVASETDSVHEVHSQKEAKSTLIQTLLHNDFRKFVVSPDHIPVVSIVGMRGIGKTTVARLVCNDQIVRNRFSKIIWVCVSDNFSELAKKIAGALHLDVTNLPDLQSVLTKIDDSIKDHTFLLVLDGVQESSEGMWNSILGCMREGNAQGSRILMTTRSLDFAMKMEAAFTFHVQELSEKDSWSLFSYYAFPSTSEEIRWRVVDLAKELVKKCYGLPLALEVLGKFMREKKIARPDWRDVLSTKTWQRKFRENVFPSLVLSYLSLPSEIKRCFTYCLIFPKDTVMKKSRLIQLWMAQGYLGGNRACDMEVIGEEYFQRLERESFFQVKDRSVDVGVTMHGLVYDFARNISNGVIVIFDPSLQVNEDDAYAKPRHLAFGGEIGKSVCSSPISYLPGLRTLFLSTHSVHILKELCSNKSYVRALEAHHISFSQDTLYKNDLNDVRNLVFLKYLRIESSYLTVLPEGICDLRYLQTLDVKGCQLLKRLPTKIGSLTTLRHLLFSGKGDINTLPKGIGKLINLRTISHFFPSSLDSEDVCNLEDLKELNHLRGDLKLYNLNQVAQVSEATMANLHRKRHVCRLTLEFGDGDASLQSEVVEALEPANEITGFLEISGYKGRRCPQWITRLRDLKEVHLKGVSMDSLPELGMLCSLEKLYVDEAKKVKHVGVEFYGRCSREDTVFFPKLTSLEFNNIPNWEHWEGPKEITSGSVTIMPSLRRLTLKHCGLRSLPCFLEHVHLERLIALCLWLPAKATEVNYVKRWRMGGIVLPETLKEMRASRVDSENEVPVNQPAEASEEVHQPHLNFKLSATSLDPGPSVPILTGLAHLRNLKLAIFEQKCLPPFGLMSFLETLTICNADNVEKVGNEFLGVSNNKDGDGGGTSTTSVAFPRLEVLYFSWMPRWKEWEDPLNRNDLTVMPSLCHLTIYGCRQLKCLPHFLEAVPLKKLELEVSVSWVGRGDMPKIRNTTAEYECRKHCVGLREHPLYKCRTASLAGLEMFLSLEILKIKSCLYVRRLGKELALISSLKELYIESMQYLEELDDPSPPQHESSSELSRHGNNNNNNSTVFNSMPHLRILCVQHCPKLKALPGFLIGIPLESLTIHDCWGLETWWANEAGEDWHNWASNIPQFKFTGWSKKGERAYEEYQVAIR